MGILSERARLLPDPKRMIPNFVGVSTKSEPTSFIVPSPPQATIIRGRSLSDSFVWVITSVGVLVFFTPPFFLRSWVLRARSLLGR